MEATPTERPLSIKEISAMANSYHWNSSVPYKYWLRAADTLYREALFSEREGNLASAYLFYLRHTSLVLDHMKDHPEASFAENKRELRKLLKRLPDIVYKLEGFKPRIERAHQEWLQESAALHSTAPSSLLSSSRSPSSPSSLSQGSCAWQTSNRGAFLDAADHQELAVDLAQREMRRRREVARSRHSRLSSDDDDDDDDSRPRRPMRPRSPQPRRSREYEYVQRSSDFGSVPINDDDNDEYDYRQQMEATRRQLDQNTRIASLGPHPDVIRNATTTHTAPTHTYAYPSISRSIPFSYEPQPLRPPRDVRLSSPHLRAPERPPKTPIRNSPTRSYLNDDDGDYSFFRSRAALLPSETSYPLRVAAAERSDSPPPLRPPKTPASPPREKERVTFRPAGRLENGNPLRPVFMPTQLRAAFLDLAADHTRRGIEMCGILAGTIVNDALFISCLLIPEQTCTSDTCETENEAALMDYCIAHDLLVLGWIHTHPTQTCFMSSRDLHTQAGYQVMMPESIAIVCAPRSRPAWGVFRLTDPPGLPHILQCTQRETFHMHAIDNIYTDAARPAGHVYESSKLEFYTHDLRPGR